MDYRVKYLDEVVSTPELISKYEDDKLYTGPLIILDREYEFFEYRYLVFYNQTFGLATTMGVTG